MNALVALLDGREVGRVTHSKGRLSFTYADSWRNAQGAYPLSLSMPLITKEHGHGAIEPFIWGLLPDSDAILSRWAQKFQVSARSAFALISIAGEDCAGAIQFVAPDKLDDFLNGPAAETQWLTRSEVAKRLRSLKADASMTRSSSDVGQFSLAGTQAKTALLFYAQRWGVPSGRTPTTHILKPAANGSEGRAENEHLCLRLAKAMGLPAAHSEVKHFEEVTAIVVERYDRVNNPNASMAVPVSGASKQMHIHRVHQEDFCQAFNVHPTQKYQNAGGPGPEKILEAIRENVSSPSVAEAHSNFSRPVDDDISTFIGALIFNWLIGGTDAHGKNYSILLGGGGTARLAPLYGITSMFGYADIDPLSARLAMKIGDEYKLSAVGLSAWRKFAARVRMDGDFMVDSLRAMAVELPDRLSDEIKAIWESGLYHPAIDKIAAALPERAGRIAKL